ncbi:RHS repeat domain-containing protein [Shewanella fidelis]|uniref:RHS repeat domain-containing protein n=1 Tax=Shewanella fidelis TaxID=173509 RepID=UPI001FE1C13A|nr:RHS repeat-associated core domain-containing protein [Shewanella fidelis]
MNTNEYVGIRYISTTLLLILCLMTSPLEAAQTIRYQHTDMLGTPVMETDEAGNVISRSVYEPFGKRLGGEKAGIGYTGHLQDEDLGLTYMQARYYDPLIGRFYSNDPKGFSNVHNFNRYAYANNNPYKYIDPDGKEALSFSVTLNIPAVMELVPNSIDHSVQGFQISANFSFPGMSGNGKYGAGLSIDGTVGGEIGTEQDPRTGKNSKFSVGKFVKSFFKTSLTGSVGFNWTKEGVTDVQNGMSDVQVGGNAVIAGGAISQDISGTTTGAEFSIGPGVNGGATADIPIVGIAVEEDKGVVLTGGSN